MLNNLESALEHKRNIEMQMVKELTPEKALSRLKENQLKKLAENQQQKEIVDKIVDLVLKNLDLKVNVDIPSLKEIIEKGLKL